MHIASDFKKARECCMQARAEPLLQIHINLSEVLRLDRHGKSSLNA
jgi:hypothetical protein